MNHPDEQSRRTADRNTAMLLLPALLLALAASPLAANTYTVTNTADSGAGSFRQALTEANGNSGLDTIAFNIDTSTDGGCAGTPKVCTIQPATALPQITSPVLIDGYTQSGSSMNTLAVGDDAVIVIELDATHVAPALNLFNASGSGSTIRGLALTHMPGYGIQVASGVDNVAITGNFIGTDATGTSVTAPNSTGIYISGANAVVGGPLPEERNIIASGSNGVYVELASDCTIQGNYVGLDKSGTVPLYVYNAVTVSNTSGCLVGGSASGEGNVIGGAGNSALNVEVGSNTTIQGNLIGTDVTGMVSASLGAHGIVYSGSGSTIGGTGAGEGNVISGNGRDGIILVYVNAPVTATIQGNKIGTDAGGTLPIPNGWCGIDGGFFASNSSLAIGGMDPGAGNVIAFNGTNGIDIAGATNTGWAILGNSIYANGNLGISLNGRCDNAAATPLANDADDVDAGANGLQNYPVITTVTLNSKTSVRVSGTLNSTADSPFHIEFFANASCDAKGNGEGKVFIGSTDVTTIGNDAGFGPLDCTVPGHRHVITATATESVDENTSEFSHCSDQDTIFSDGLEEEVLVSPVCTLAGA